MSPPRTTFTARSPVDLVAVVPQVLGFHPEDSVVLLTFGSAENFHARVDLPEDEDDQRTVVELLAAVLARHRVRRVAVLLYTADPWLAATFHDAIVPTLVRDRVEVVEVLRVADGRFHDAGDPHDAGVRYDLRAHRFTAEQVVRGRVVHASREHVAAGLRLVDAVDARAVAEAADRVERRLDGLLAFDRPEQLRRDLRDHARWLQRAVRRHVEEGTRPSADDAARILVLVSVTELRDVVWAEMSRERAAEHVELWRDLVRRCPRDRVPAAASLLAFAAWLSGDGALAWCALDRCAEVDQDYSMAACVRDALEAAVPPSVWAPIKEDELAVFWPVAEGT